MSATDLGIDFRKLECEEINSSYTSTCTRDEIDDEKRSPRERKLAYELGRRSSGLSGLGWPDLDWTGAGWLGLAAPGAVCLWPCV